MKKELEHYWIETFYGGDQNWFKNPWMKMGGCGAVTACDLCIYLETACGKPQVLQPWDESTLLLRFKYA